MLGKPEKLLHIYSDTTLRAGLKSSKGGQGRGRPLVINNNELSQIFIGRYILPIYLARNYNIWLISLAYAIVDVDGSKLYIPFIFNRN